MVKPVKEKRLNHDVFHHHHYVSERKIESNQVPLVSDKFNKKVLKASLVFFSLTVYRKNNNQNGLLLLNERRKNR